MLSTKITGITTSQNILTGQYTCVYIKNTSAVTVTLSGSVPAVADEGYPLAAGATWVFDMKAAGVANLKLQAIANSGTGSLSILAI